MHYTETCTPLGPSCWVGRHPAGVKTPLPIHEGASQHNKKCGIRPSTLQGRSKPTDWTSVSETRRLANTCLLIDISCPADGNVCRKHAEKLTKYGDLEVEISCMWQCQTQVVPMVLGALGTVHSGIALCHHNLQHLQKAVLLGSTWILCKVMSSSV